MPRFSTDAGLYPKLSRRNTYQQPPTTLKKKVGMILHLLQLGSHQCWLEYLWVPIINMHNGQISINRFWIWHLLYLAL
ncbi:unnamed protein product [Sphagnum balticum]